MNDKMLQEHEKKINRTYKLICERTDLINMLSAIYVSDDELFNQLEKNIKKAYFILKGE